MVRVRTFPTSHDASFRRWHDISVAVRRHDEVDPPLPSLDRQRTMFETGTRMQGRELFLALSDERAVGAGEIVLRFTDNTQLAECAAWVLPDVRRQGIGSALLDHISRRATEERRATLLATVIGPPGVALPGAEFLEHRGFVLANTMIGRTLRLPVSKAKLDELETNANARPRSYHVASWAGPCPARYAERYAYLRGLHVHDAPTGAVDIDRERWDVVRLREEERQLARAGTTVYTTVALGAAGDVVAYTRALVSDDDRHLSSQGQTLVEREHRGNRLGLAVKVANLRALQEAEPTLDRIGTATAEQNSPMIAINEQLGFRIHDVGQEWQRTVADTPAPTF